MQAVLFTLVFPVLPYLLWRSYNRERKVGAGEIILRYLFYLLVISCISAMLLAVLSDTDTSFMEKMDKSASFALKYALMELGAALLTAFGEWSYVKKKYPVQVDWDGFASWRPLVFCRKYIGPALPYLLAALVVGLNLSLIFDNVVWGDEAFSVNTAQNSMFGVMQVVYYLDSHPPLYYYWLKLWGDLFGFSIPVCHLASVIPFAAGIVLALFPLRRRLGAVPAAFFMVLSGLGMFALEYNLEIRMYALAFFCLTACFYCSYRVISSGRKSSWIGLVLWGLAGAYSHYYALVAGGLLVFFTGAAVWLRYRKKTWIRGLCAVLAFLLGYSPWMFVLYNNIKSVSSNWWMTEILKLSDALNVVFLGGRMMKIVMPLLLFLCLVVLAVDCGIVRRMSGREDGLIRIETPGLKKWDDKTWAIVTGLLTVAGTVAFGYFLCLVMAPVLVDRYLYPVSSVTVCVIALAGSRMLEILKEFGEKEGLPHLQGIGRGIMACICLVLLVMGLENYGKFRGETKLQNERTQETLDIIGTPDESVQMVTNGVKHLGWTVLAHYYPDNEVVNHDYRGGESESFWYFNTYELSPEEVAGLEDGGMTVTAYGEHWISQYSFYLYHMERGGGDG